MPPVRSYRTLSPLPRMRGGLLSVALSFELPRLAVNQHHALWSSDFPPALCAPATTRPGRRDKIELGRCAFGIVFGLDNAPVHQQPLAASAGLDGLHSL